MIIARKKPPDWDALYEIAATQDGHFATNQAHDAGFSDQLLVKYLHAGRIVRVRRCVYRIVHFPASEHEDLAVAWLWSERMGVFSHETALSLHSLSDVLPSVIHMTLPESWRARRLRVPADITLYFADVPEDERTWFGSVPVTHPRRTIEDCVKSHVSPEVIHKAIEDSVKRGLIDRKVARRFRSKTSV